MKNSRSGLLSYLLGLTGFFALLEVSYFIQRSHLYLSEYKLVTSHLAIPLRIIPGVIFYVGAQVCVHVGFTILVWGLARLVGIGLKCRWRTVQAIGINFWFLAILTSLVANQYFYPNSQFSALTSNILDKNILNFICYGMLSICGIIFCIAVVGIIRALPAVSRMLIGLIFISSTTGFMAYHYAATADASTSDKPNIIIIGIDSLRPDYVGFLGGDTETPNLDAFLAQSTTFASAMTPQARTFPAWISILTGKYPKNVNARYDLQDKAELRFSNETLPQLLQHEGYETIFATDESRFSNIDDSYGFHQTIMPPVGVNDFLLGSVNDFPLSNLVVNTSLGKWLFPYSYGNRPSYITYDPDSFLQMLKTPLARSRSKPLFLAVHFCLPHFPYVWKDYTFHGIMHASVHYRHAVQRVDQQLGDFFAILAQSGILQHSIVIVLSDHGEAMNLHGDRATDKAMYIAGKDNSNKIIPRFYPASTDKETMNQSEGHGTDVLGLTQYHTVLAVRFYGLPAPAPHVVPEVVSLIDIKPTILSFLGFASQNDDGMSLVPLIFRDKTLPLSQRHFFMESDFSPQAVRSAHPETRKLLFAGIDFFRIDPITTKLVVKKSMGKLIVSSKQYADLYGEWLLALYPQASGPMQPVLINLNTGYWTTDLSTDFAKHSSANVMLTALKQFYGNEIHLF